MRHSASLHRVTRALVFLLASGPVLTLLGAEDHAMHDRKADETRAVQALQAWLPEAIDLGIESEVSDAATRLPLPVGADLAQSLAPLPLAVAGRWSVRPNGAICDLEFTGTEARLGHTMVLDLPVLTDRCLVFTPSERGVLSVAAMPDYQPAVYGHLGWDDGRYYVLPLVSVLNPAANTALTIALPPDANIPHLQVSWRGGHTLRLQLAHRGMGGGQPSTLRALFYTHESDYRSALKAYSDDFPRYFRPTLPRGPYEGAFWYHHIQDHPDFTDMARQKMRFIWSSFWFTHLGEYLPAEQEWFPYTYAKWWSLGEAMNDGKILAFIDDMHEHGIGVFAYFNVTEYGGAGGKEGDTATAARLLQEQFADALMKDEAGEAIPTWEGAMAMNARPDCALFPALSEQIRRHVTRLPELDGFVIDRLDWGSRYDFGHDDDLTMIGARRVQNMAGPVGDGVAEVCRQSHAAGWRVYVNQFWRVDMLRDVDGYCHESDIVRGIGYLAPRRPAAAWHMRKTYHGDLLQFEGQLKQRLQFALQPQMIAHEFPISQQGANPNAADLLEIYAPLFDVLDGKDQVLTPHCVAASGANDVNLFVNRRGHQVMPLTSRLRFLSRRVDATETVTVTLRSRSGSTSEPVDRAFDAAGIEWAWVISADGPPYRADLSRRDDAVDIAVARHGTASIVVAGAGAPPSWDTLESGRLAAIRDRLFPMPTEPGDLNRSTPPAAVQSAKLSVAGARLGERGSVAVVFGGRVVGQINDGPHLFPVDLDPTGQLAVELRTGDEGTWFAPQRIRLLARLVGGNLAQAAEWTPRDPVDVLPGFGRVRYPLRWGPVQSLPTVASRFEGRTRNLEGAWHGKLGRQAVWIPQVASELTQSAYQLRPGGQPFTWQEASGDKRVLQRPEAAQDAPPASCWFAPDELPLTVTPADLKPYRLTAYLLDFDRNGRAIEATVEDTFGAFADRQETTVKDTAEGIYLTWTVSGEVTLTLRKLAGFNVVLSGIFIDAAEDLRVTP